MSESGRPGIVAKVGGSLFDLPDLGPRLARWRESLGPTRLLLVPGGGDGADVVRRFDSCHRLGEEVAHWLALHALTFNGHLLEALVPGGRLIEGVNACAGVWRRGGVPILDAFRFARGDESRPDHPPHTWAVTSDSLAARIAIVAGAERLVLLKSAPPPAGDWSAAGYVDAHFPEVVRATSLRVEAVDLRGG